MKKIISIIALLLGLAQAAMSQNIVAGEYFWDTDPGIGLGTALTAGEIAGGIGDETFNLNIATPSTSLGQHVLYVRFKQNDTLWSQAIGYPILIGPENFLAGAVDQVDSSEIKELDYYWNANANLSQTVTLPASDATFTSTIGLSTTGAEVGNNIFNYRIKDKYGLYSPWQSTSIMVFGGVPEVDSIKFAFNPAQYTYTGTAPNQLLNVSFVPQDKIDFIVNTGNPADSADVTGNKHITTSGMAHGSNVLSFKIFGSEPVDAAIPASEDSYLFQQVVKIDTSLKLNLSSPRLANGTLSTEYCPGGLVKVPIAKVGNWPQTATYGIPTVFTVKLKRTSGPALIALSTIVNLTNDTLTATLPTDVPSEINDTLWVESSFPYFLKKIPVGIKVGFTAAINSAGLNICEKGTVNMSAFSSVTASYSWSGPAAFTATGATASRTNLQLSHAGIYTLTATSTVAGCMVQTTANLTVKPLPIVATSVSTPVCEQAAISFTSSSSNGGTFQNWQKISPNSVLSTTDANPTIASASLADAGSYKVIYSLNGCYRFDTVTVVVKPLPQIISTSTNAPLCSGNNLVVSATATAGSTFAWTGPNGFSNTNDAWSISSATTSASGTYSLTVTKDGCSTSGTLSNVVNQTPTVSTTSPVSICEGTSLQLNVNNTPSATYGWSGPGPFSSIAEDPVVSANATTAMSGTYSITVTLGTCSANGIVAVTVKPLPQIISTSTNAPLCSGSNLVVSAEATVGSTFAWTGPNGFSNSNDAWSISSATTAASGTYSLTVTKDGCSTVTTLSNVVNQTPTVSTTSPVSICEGTSLQLNVNNTPSATYGWSGPGPFSSIAEDPVVSANATTSMSGTYSITVTLGTCSANGNVVVMVNANPELFTVNQSAVAGGSVNLTLPAITVGSTLPEGTTLAYFSDAAGTVALPSPGNITVSGTYYIKATSPGTCVDIEPVVVTICGGVYDPITAPISSGTVSNISTQKITATNVISGSGTNVLYRSTVHIELKPGFKAENGTVFQANIGGCI